MLGGFDSRRLHFWLQPSARFGRTDWAAAHLRADPSASQRRYSARPFTPRATPQTCGRTCTRPGPAGGDVPAVGDDECWPGVGLGVTRREGQRPALELGRVAKRCLHLVLDVRGISAVVAAELPERRQVAEELLVLRQTGGPALVENAAARGRISAARREEHAVADRTDRTAASEEGGDLLLQAARRRGTGALRVRARLEAGVRRTRGSRRRSTRGAFGTLCRARARDRTRTPVVGRRVGRR